MKNLTKDYLKKFTKDSWIAFRPLSLTLAVGSTTLGIIAAYLDGSMKNYSLGLLQILFLNNSFHLMLIGLQQATLKYLNL